MCLKESASTCLNRSVQECVYECEWCMTSVCRTVVVRCLGHLIHACPWVLFSTHSSAYHLTIPLILSPCLSLSVTPSANPPCLFSSVPLSLSPVLSPFSLCYYLSLPSPSVPVTSCFHHLCFCLLCPFLCLHAPLDFSNPISCACPCLCSCACVDMSP